MKSVGSSPALRRQTGRPKKIGVVAGAAIAALSLAGLAAGLDRRGFVWANQPTLANYFPSASHSFNSLGLTNIVTRLGTGTYQVRFFGLGGSNGHVQVLPMA